MGEEQGAGPATVAGPEHQDRNEVVLEGRISGTPQLRVLPSGDELVALRLVVRRAGGGADTIDVSVGPAPAAGGRRVAGQVGRRLLNRAARLEADGRAQVQGHLRRRWWSTPAGRQSRVEVAATDVRPTRPTEQARPHDP